MFARVTVTASDLERSRRFYETLLGDGPWPEFALAQADAEHPPTRKLHLAFGARSREEVDERWQAAVGAGFTSDGEPGPRDYTPDYYGGFLLDPDGNSAEVVHGVHAHDERRPIDHLWIGVADLEASVRFWEGVAPAFGLRVERKTRLAAVSRDDRHFAVVADGRPPTENVRIALPDLDGNAVEVL